MLGDDFEVPDVRAHDFADLAERASLIGKSGLEEEGVSSAQSPQTAPAAAATAAKPLKKRKKTPTPPKKKYTHTHTSQAAYKSTSPEEELG